MAIVTKQEFDKLEAFLNLNLVQLFKKSPYISIEIERVRDQYIRIWGKNTSGKIENENEFRISITHTEIYSNVSPGRFVYEPGYASFLYHRDRREKKLGKFKKIFTLANDAMKQYEQHIRQLIDEKNKVEDFKYNAISEFDDGNFNVTTRGTRTIDIASKTREMEKRSYYGQETTTVPLPLLTLSAQPDGQYSIDSGSGMIREWDKFEFKAHHIKELAEFLEKVMFENEHMTDYLEEDDD